MVLTAISDLVENLNERNIPYCHWKSNWTLAETLEGETDVDLLIDRRSASAFRSVLRDLGFRPAIEAGVPALPSVEHYHALDGSGAIAHVHAYYRVISGESLAKNYHFPVESMLLGNRRLDSGIPIPTAGAELVVFVLRMLLKHTSPIELGLILRDAAALNREVEWLVSDDAIAEARSLLPKWIPQIDDRLFISGVDALRPTGGTIERIVVGFRMRRRLKAFARHNRLRALGIEGQKFAQKSIYRLLGTKKKLTPGGGGMVIAFVGSEATGKSTLIGEVASWLGKHYTVHRIHAGKPPLTAVTALPHVLLPLMRILLPKQRTTKVEARDALEPESLEGSFSLAFGVRAVMLAYERRALLARAYAKSSNGAIVLCDRYPSAGAGAPDSAQLSRYAPAAVGSLRHRLQKLEAQIYRDIPSPDQVFHLWAPLDVTLARNRARDKFEPEPYVRLRHAKNEQIVFRDVVVNEIDTDRPLTDVIGEVERRIWEAL